MKKMVIAGLTLASINICAQTNLQEPGASLGSNSYNKVIQTNRICISMAEELEKIKSKIANAPEASVDFIKNKEAYIHTAAEWIRVCGPVR